MKRIFKIFLITAAAVVLICYFLYQKHLASVCFKENCFRVELAKTAEELERGLMHRENLDRDRGMLFIFDKEGIYPFWMKNTLISLDIIWIDSAGKVVFIKENAQPCGESICPSITPEAKAQYVLEINAGLCHEINLQVGDKLKTRDVSRGF